MKTSITNKLLGAVTAAGMLLAITTPINAKEALWDQNEHWSVWGETTGVGYCRAQSTFGTTTVSVGLFRDRTINIVLLDTRVTSVVHGGEYVEYISFDGGPAIPFKAVGGVTGNAVIIKDLTPKILDLIGTAKTMHVKGAGASFKLTGSYDAILKAIDCVQAISPQLSNAPASPAVPDREA